MLTENEKKRYARQMLMDGWGEAGQEKLKNSTVFIAGAGGLGSPVAIYLAVAGVGHIRICDFDKPDLSNLNRQILHDDTRFDVNKAVSAKVSLAFFNPNIKVTSITEKIVEDNAESLVDGADLILDCMDNFPTRFLLNRVSIKNKIPLIHGCVWGMDGRLSFFHPPQTPCLECLYSDAPPKEMFPVVGATPGVIGTLQALEAVKYLTGIGTNIKGKLLVWEGSTTSFKTLKLLKDPACPACSAAKP